MIDADLLVVGGGPVGLAAAIEARLAGMSVLICEPRTGPVDKACGEGLMPGALRLLSRIGVDPTGRDFNGIRYLGRGLAVEHRFRSGPGRGVRRTVLHGQLARRAAEMGVQTVPTRVGLVRQDVAGVTVDGDLRARWLFACDGLHSSIRRQLGLQRLPSRPARYGVRRHFRVSPWSDAVEVHWTPEAEIYVTPVDHDLVGVAVLGPRNVQYDDAIASARGVRERLHGAAAASDLRGAGPMWQDTVRRTAGRVLLVGDAGGYVDALTGEGIRLGLAQARAAVAAVAAGRPGDYERAWRRESRDYRLLTAALVTAAGRRGVRSRIVPLAHRLPRVYGAIVERLAA
ncbi:MAG TPA: NAD(P)/FAD-dependent oxidoreductase [Jiangellaceae bacterium]|nr:NAD(P)/FAD-dependent oxidoreductase [Jiangellaceae bacterium]